MSKFFDWLRPARRRERRAVDVELNTAILARLADTDAVYRCLMDHAYTQFENDTLAMLQSKLPAPEREFLAGRCNAMAAYINTIESQRVRWAEIERQREKKGQG